ncbi:YdaU family protein, partial [Xylella fastidiosa]
MNYYIRNIDEYARETKHLSLQEHGIYFLLLDHYYTTEKPIPADKTHTYRIAYARTKKEKSAVDFVLDTFFSLQEDGWHNKRCDEEIAAYKEGDAWHEHKEANKNGQNTRTRRHRKERSRLFAELKDHQVTPEWNMPIKELRLLHKKTCNAPVTAVTPPVTPTQEESFTSPSSSLRSEESLIRAENETSIKELRQWNAKTNAKTCNAPVTAVTAKPLTI